MRFAAVWAVAIGTAAMLVAGHTAYAQPPAPAGLGELLKQSRQLGEAGRHAEAYRALALHEDRHIGEVEFDYAIGRAALDAGLPDRATLAFTRVLATEPGHAGAAIDMGRAYLALGNRAQARAVFEALLAAGPPSALRERLEFFLAQANAPAGSGASLRGYLAVGLGRDSNVNAATGQPSVFIPLFGAELQLASANVRRADRYSSLTGGVEASIPLGEQHALIGGADMLQRGNAHERTFDLGAASARAGLAAVAFGLTARAQVMSGRSYLDHRASRDTRALVVDARASLGPALEGSAYLQRGRARHLPVEQRVFDADFIGTGAGVTWTLAAGAQLYAGLSAGNETDRGGNPGGDRRLYGPRLGLEIPLLPGVSLVASSAWQATDYERPDVAFQTVRRDRRRDLELAAQYRLAEGWRLRAGMLDLQNRSNVPIYSFDRRDLGLSLRYDFQ